MAFQYCRGVGAVLLNKRRRFVLLVAVMLLGVLVPAGGAAAVSFTNRTTADGLGNNSVRGVYVVGSTVYAATNGGLSISTDSGATFTNRTTSDGLGVNGVRGVYVDGSNVYAATRTGGLSISTDGGATFTNYTTSDGLGSNTTKNAYAVGGNVYAATLGGLSTGTISSGGAGAGGGSARAVPQVVSVDLDLEAAELPASGSQSATLGSWYQLPASADVVGVGENAGKTFLGVATREDFPVAIAQRQVDNGWGVYEIYDADGRLASVFIPAGKSLHLTAVPRLHAIWSQ